MKAYIAAGFDPARFWVITPRLFVIEMDGAAMRDEYRRADIWFTAMLPHLKEPPPLDQFVYGRKGNRAEIARCLEAWDKVDAGLRAHKVRSGKIEMPDTASATNHLT